MQNTFKKNMFETYLKDIEAVNPDLSEAARRKIADKLTNTGMDLLVNNGKYLRDLVGNAIMEREAAIAELKDLVDQIITRSEKVKVAMMHQGMVTVEYDNAAKHNVMRARSSVLQECVDFLNYLNRKVVGYYKETFDVDQKQAEQGKLL
jgi:hypothetical protein